MSPLRLFALAPLAACSLLPVDRSAAHCDLRVAGEPRSYCQEWRGVMDTPGADASGVALCDALGTEYVATECPDTDAVVGGCYVDTLGDGSASYHWYYSSEAEPLTADAVRSTCEGAGDTFVEWFPFDAEADDFGPQ